MKKIINNINHMALPLVLNSVTGMLIGLVDQAMVGRISLNAFSAVGLISTTFNSIAGLFGMIAVAFNILGAKDKGEGNEQGLENKFVIGIYISSFLGLIFSVVFSLFAAQILSFIFGLKGEVLKEAVNYGRIFSLTVGLNMILFMYSSYFKIVDKTKYLFYGNATAAISNVVLDYILIYGKFGFNAMGVSGAAIASVLALVINLFIYIVVMNRISSVSVVLQISCHQIIKLLKELFKISLPIIGQEFLESTLILICINAILTRIGILELSIYNLSLSLVAVILMPMYSYSSTALTMVSEKLGERNLEKVKAVPKFCLMLASLFCIFIAIVFIVLKKYVPRLITDDINLILGCSKYLIFAILANTFNIPSNVYKYSLQGIGDERWVFINSVKINAIGISLIILFSRVLNLKLMGVFGGMFINFFLLALFSYIRYNARLEELREEFLTTKKTMIL